MSSWWFACLYCFLPVDFTSLQLAGCAIWWHIASSGRFVEIYTKLFPATADQSVNLVRTSPHASSRSTVFRNTKYHVQLTTADIYLPWSIYITSPITDSFFLWTTLPDDKNNNFLSKNFSFYPGQQIFKSIAVVNLPAVKYLYLFVYRCFVMSLTEINSKLCTVSCSSSSSLRF